MFINIIFVYLMHNLNIMCEIYRKVINYENELEVSNKGNLKSIDRFINWNGTKQFRKGVLYKLQSDERGYLIKIYKNKKLRIHKLVYEAFIGSIPKGYDVHHINGIKTDNRVENLCLLEKSRHSKMHRKDYQKEVEQYTLDGKYIQTFKSADDAAKYLNKINSSHISAVCLGKRFSAYGSIWKYKEAVN